MILIESEDQQLLVKTLQGIKDYLHICYYFDQKQLFSSLIQYLCTVIPQLITIYVNSNQGTPSPTPTFTDEQEESIQTWKCVQSIHLLLSLVTQYQTFIDDVGLYKNNKLFITRNGKILSISSSG